MQENTIFVNRYQKTSVLPINEKEIWRYAGYLGKTDSMDEELVKTLDQVVNDLADAFSYKVCYRRAVISWENDMPVLPFKSESKNLAKALEGSSEVIIFAATIGLDIDRYIARWQRISPVKALMAQAYGAERIESLCETFCRDISCMADAEGLGITARFSPGYGDMPLESQKDFFRLLDCSRQIGVSLNESLLMTPSKSVTAIFGLGEGLTPKTHDCTSCSKLDCEYRKLDQ